MKWCFINSNFYKKDFIEPYNNETFCFYVLYLNDFVSICVEKLHYVSTF